MSTLSDFSDDENHIVINNENEEIDANNFEDVEEKEDGNQNKTRRIDPKSSQKYVVHRLIPKLNAERLKSSKGIQSIEKHFEGFKFYGKGHEKKDLDRIMKRLEHWAHRLFPKLHFDDFLDKVENLGVKKDLQVFIKKYRLDMLSTADNEYTENNPIEEDSTVENEPIDEFDLLIAEQIEKQKQTVIQQNSIKVITQLNADDEFYNFNTTQESLIESSQIKVQEKTKDVDKSNLNNIKEKIEKNRQEAIKRRLARQKALENEAKRTKTEKDKVVEISKESNANSSTQQQTDLEINCSFDKNDTVIEC